MTTAPAPTPLDGIVEFFTLSRARAQLTRLGEGRTLVSKPLALGRQRAEAAETLWSNGHTAEALRLACGGLESTLDAATQLATSMKLEDAPKVTTAPVARRAPPPETREPTGEQPAKTDDAPTEPKADEPKASETAAPEPSEPSDSLSTDAKPADAVEGEAPPAEIAKTETKSGKERWRAALVARATRPSRIERVASAVVAMRAATLPTYDSEVSSANADLFQTVMDARHIVDDAIGASVWTSGEMAWARARRWFGASLALVALVTGAYFALHQPEGTFVSASDVWSQSPTFVADMAVDGRSDTAWLLPDRATGWLEVRMSPGRHVESVQLINTSNAPHGDRGTREYRLEVYSHGELARAVDGEFEWSDHPEPLVIEVGLDEVERVRFVVRSFHRTGGGLAEMTIR